LRRADNWFGIRLLCGEADSLGIGDLSPMNFVHKRELSCIHAALGGLPGRLSRRPRRVLSTPLPEAYFLSLRDKLGKMDQIVDGGVVFVTT
jgi:hypothetical protein